MVENQKLTEALEAYIKAARKMDLTDKEIAQKLIDKKYPKELVEAAFKSEAEIGLPPKLMPITQPRRLLPAKMKGDGGFIKMEEVPKITPIIPQIEEFAEEPIEERYFDNDVEVQAIKKKAADKEAELARFKEEQQREKEEKEEDEQKEVKEEVEEKPIPITGEQLVQIVMNLAQRVTSLEATLFRLVNK